MVDYCANPKCMKPLHYLREGTVYIFGTPRELGAFAPRGHRLEHYWLCGDCSVSYLLERTPNEEVRLIPKHTLRFVRRPVEVSERVLAS